MKGWFANFRENRENIKYLDDTIRTNIVIQPKTTPPSKSTFQNELQRVVSEKAKSHEQTQVPNVPEQEMFKSDIGG